MSMRKPNLEVEWDEFLFEFNSAPLASLKQLNITPIASEFGEGTYRVPVRIESEKHTVYVGDNHLRIFDADTLPAFLKHKLAMIIVTGSAQLLERDDLLTRLKLYQTRGDMPNTGWQASPSMFIVILSNDELESLKGNNET
jgi:hypothetical protein